MAEFDPTPLEKRYATVNGKRMAYHEVGEGRSVVFVHGNPTSSYLWRNVIPHVSGQARCVAPDLIGMGDSDKLDDTGPDSYRFVEHSEYLDGLLDQLDLGDDIVLVIHDWGCVLGFDWANRHRDRVTGIAFMEALVRPFTSWDEFPPDARPMFEGLRSPAGEDMVFTKNFFVEALLPGSTLRKLTQHEHDEYRRPFLEIEHRRPMLTWPRQIPIAGDPAEVHQIVVSYAEWLRESDIPKLFVNADPGSLTAFVEDCRGFPNLTEMTVAGIHYLQEDSPHEIGHGIADWLPTLDQP